MPFDGVSGGQQQDDDKSKWGTMTKKETNDGSSKGGRWVVTRLSEGSG
jgi:hypothetical protein